MQKSEPALRSSNLRHKATYAISSLYDRISTLQLFRPEGLEIVVLGAVVNPQFHHVKVFAWLLFLRKRFTLKRQLQKSLWRQNSMIFLLAIGTLQNIRIQRKKYWIGAPNWGFATPPEALEKIMLKRATNNPILQPCRDHPWESDYVFNTAALYLEDRVHLVYRAIGQSGLSVFGYASSKDGIHIDERLRAPIYLCKGPRAYKVEECKKSSYAHTSGGSWSGCEDPRLTQLEGTIYLTYTTFNGWSSSPPGMALTSISVEDFLHKRWHWQKPKLLSPPNEMHKNWVLFPEKINGKFAILHSISPAILIDYFDDLDGDGLYVRSHYSSSEREAHWDTWVRGVGPPPIKTQEGWLVLYHAMDKRDLNRYKIGAMLLDADDPTKILHRATSPLLEPDAIYENQGFKPGVIYSCGAVLINETLYVYYGAADTVVCVATADLNSLLNQLQHSCFSTH